METGHLVYQIQEPHGPGNEMTAVNVNMTGYRLVSGAYDGTYSDYILTPSHLVSIVRSDGGLELQFLQYAVA